MCDEESSGLQNIPQSHPRREPKIILQRAEYRFPALKNSLVSVFVHRTEQYKCEFSEHFFWELIQLNIFPHLFSLIEVLTQLWHSIWNILSYKKFAPLYTQCKLSYHCATSRKVPGSIPGSVTVNFFRGTPDRTMCPEVHSASESEYQGFSLW